MISAVYFIFKLRAENNKYEYIKIYLLSNIFGFLVSSIQTVPFFEYLVNSWALFERHTLNIGNILPIYSIIYNIFPNISGNPASNYYHSLLNQSYNELVGAYVGPIISLFSIICIILYLRKDRNVAFFSFLGLSILPFIYQVPLFSSMAVSISKMIANARLQFVLSFIQAVLTSIFINKFVYSEKFRKLKILSWTILISIIVSPIMIKIFTPNFLKSFNMLKVNNFVKYLSLQTIILEVTLLFALLLITNSRKINKSFSYIILTVLVFMQTGLLNFNFNPVIEKKYIYPQTEDIKFLMNLPKGRVIELGGDYILPPNTNLIFNIPSINNYDALEIKNYKSLYNSVFNNKSSWGTILNTNENYMDLFGIKYILSYTDINNTIVNDQPFADSLVGELTSEMTLKQEFTASNNYLYGLRILPANYNRKNDCRFSFNLFEQASNKLLFQKIISCENIYDKIHFDIDFPVINDSKQKKYSFEINIIDGFIGNTISFWKNNKGSLVLNTKYKLNEKGNYQKIYDNNFKIFENKYPSSDYYLVQKLIIIIDEKEALSEISNEDFDSKKQAIISESNLNVRNINNKGTVDIIEQSQISSKLNVNSESNIFIATKLAYYPGWKAYIDNKITKIYRTNLAFQGIFVPPGEHIILFKYQPLSFSIGVFLSLAGVIFLIFYIKKSEKK